MARIINISDKFDNEKPSIEINGKNYAVNDSVSTMMKFEELATKGTSQGMMEALKLTLGEKSYKELGIENMRFPNLKVIFTAILAAMQDMSYEEAEKRFRK